jgi:hypothetical protein
MDEKRYDNQKCFTTKGRNLMVRLLWVVLFTMLIVTMPFNLALAQDPCSEIGSDCRVLTAAEVKAFKDLIMKVKNLLPVPDPSRYAPDGADEASTMPFVALTKISGAVFIGRSWQAGCFPTDFSYNTLHFGYKAKADQKKPAGKAKDPLAATQTMIPPMLNEIELSVELLPHPYLMQVYEPDPDAYNIEKSADFLSWQTGDDNVTLYMIFGARTGKEAETLNTDKPNPKFAPLKSIMLSISGPKDDVAALKKRIDRRAFEALLGPVVK